MRIFSDRPFYRELLRMTAPIALQSLMLASVAAGDAVMLGRIEQDSMAAVSLATQIQFIQNMIVMAVTGTGAILGAQYFGKGDRKTLDRIFAMMLKLSGLVSLLFMLACILFPRTLMLIFTNEESLIGIGIGYLRIAGWSYLLTGISQCYLTMMKVTDHVARSAWISSGAVLINIGLNAVFIFGLFGMPAMGARGAALATLLARAIELAWAVASSFGKGFLRLKIGTLFRKNGILAQDFRKCCLPLLGGSLFWGVGFTMYTVIIGHLGADAAAANSIAAVVRELVCCLSNGIASAGGILVGNLLGRGELEKGKLYGGRLARLSFLVGFLDTAVVLAVMPFVLNFMSLTDTAREYLFGMLIITSVYMIGRASNTVIINGVFSAGGDTIFDMYSLAVCMWGIALPVAALGAFVFHWPVFLVYGCTCLDEVGKIPWVLLHYRKYKWVRDLTRENV